MDKYFKNVNNTFIKVINEIFKACNGVFQLLDVRNVLKEW